MQWANLRLCQVRKEDALKFTYKAVSLTKRLEEVDRPSLEVRCSMVKLLIECEQLGIPAHMMSNHHPHALGDHAWSLKSVCA